VRSSSRGRLVALVGPSAVGKTTVGRAVAAAAGFVFLPEPAAAGDPLPSLEFGTPAQLAAIEARLMAVERRRSRAAERLRADGVDVLLDTAPVGPATYSLGVARLHPEYRPVAERIVAAVRHDLESGRISAPDRVLHLDASPATLRRRAAGVPSTHPADLLARHWAVARYEREFWGVLASERPDAVRMISLGAPMPSAARRVAKALVRPGRPLGVGALLGALQTAGRVPPVPRKVTVKNRASSRRPPRR